MNNPDHYILKEHQRKEVSAEITFDKIIPREFHKPRGNEAVFAKNIINDKICLEANYYVGIDWLIKGKYSVEVEPKVNTKFSEYFNNQTNIEESEVAEKKAELIQQDFKSGQNYVELDYLKMLLDVMEEPITAGYSKYLVQINWKEPQIAITQKQDQLTPFLIVQFLQLLKVIVKKSLIKSYYKKRENLTNKVKGKVLVGQHIKQNMFKNRFTQTYCEYQAFGIDNLENRFLKKVWRFCSSYIENHEIIFKGNYFVTQLLNYTSPAFEQVEDEISITQLKNVHHNPFFKEYDDAITIGGYILKKYAYNITNTTDMQIQTPPYWIDMPILFELYFYAKLIKANPNKARYINYQFSTYGNALDFLISDPESAMIIDTKSKLKYQWSQIHEDIRQVSGYARLNKVLNEIKNNNPEFNKDTILPCLIVYPDVSKETEEDFSLENLKKQWQPIKAYNKIYKMGIRLPLIKT